MAIPQDMSRARVKLVVSQQTASTDIAVLLRVEHNTVLMTFVHHCSDGLSNRQPLSYLAC